MPDPLAPNTPVMYTCVDPTTYFINGAFINMCDDTGMYVNEAPTCERSKLFAYLV